ncbi:MAG TPA: RNA 2',3'-cyclic phosphodiesterase [Pyrinomonadaceae bacterium]|nr:RNA 2',3'-cyclic phosphodiesterase [Pyrinomonadaceae bacterium]
METWRVFCAVELSSSVRKKLIEHSTRLRELAPDVQASWSREQNLHLTLKFLGQVQTSRLERLSKAAAKAATGLPTIQLSIEETGAFPKHGRPRVLWVGVKDASGGLRELQRRLEEACDREGFAKEERTFHPHLTLARLRNPQSAQELVTAHKQLSFEPMAVTVRELLVLRSELNTKGSKYSVISRHEIGRK